MCKNATITHTIDFKIYYFISIYNLKYINNHMIKQRYNIDIHKIVMHELLNDYIFHSNKINSRFLENNKKRENDSRVPWEQLYVCTYFGFLTYSFYQKQTIAVFTEDGDSSIFF